MTCAGVSAAATLRTYPHPFYSVMRHADIKTTLAFYTDVDGVLEKAILQA